MKRWICILIIGLLGISACWSHSGLKPIYPQAMTSPVVTDSVQPTLRWKPASESNVTYDVIIYDVIKTQTPLTKPREIGKVVYYREGIKESQHKIEDPLNSNTEYFWSIRFRSGEKVSDWSTWSYSFYAGGVSVQQKDVPFVFKTPGISPVKGIKQREGQIVVDKDTKVYVSFNSPLGAVSPTNKYFHKKDCKHISSISTKEVTAGEAITQGKSMCPYCFR